MPGDARDHPTASPTRTTSRRRARLAHRRPVGLVPDPVSWMVIEQGWSVVDADGDDVGRIDEVLGDQDADIFNGLQVLTGVLGTPNTCLRERSGRSSKAACNST